jgi:methionyl-tRNA formyltransferase
MRIACVGYREWALKIYDGLSRETDNTFLIIRSKKQFDEQAILDFKPDMILFYGWSWIVDEGILSSADCIMLHPSPLPKYRGGSPLQNQIISGEQSSKVTLFIMTNELDAGDIIAQEELSLRENLNSILNNISEIGLRLTKKILDDGYSRTQQEQDKATYCKRRNPSDSELTIRELQECDGDYLYNKIRMLADPYPNAYIVTVDGKKLYIKLAELG